MRLIGGAENGPSNSAPYHERLQYNKNQIRSLQKVILDLYKQGLTKAQIVKHPKFKELKKQRDRYLNYRSSAEANYVYVKDTIISYRNKLAKKSQSKPKRTSSKKKRASQKRRTPKRKSSKRKSSKRKYSKRKSSKRKSPKRKSPKRTSKKKRASKKRRSPKRKSPKRAVRNRHSPSLDKKRSERPSPSASAAEKRIGTVQKGNDGRMYKVKSDKNGTKRWYPAT
jgi:hypothetical protein